MDFFDFINRKKRQKQIRRANEAENRLEELNKSMEAVKTLIYKTNQSEKGEGQKMVFSIDDEVKIKKEVYDTIVPTNLKVSD